VQYVSVQKKKRKYPANGITAIRCYYIFWEFQSTTRS